MGCKVANYDVSRVFERAGWHCYLCGKPCDRSEIEGPLTPTIDHVLALSRGGSDTLDNVDCAHRECNIRKSDHTIQELFEMDWQTIRRFWQQPHYADLQYRAMGGCRQCDIPPLTQRGGSGWMCKHFAEPDRGRAYHQAQDKCGSMLFLFSNQDALHRRGLFRYHGEAVAA
jgi:hypothetical protein